MEEVEAIIARKILEHLAARGFDVPNLPNTAEDEDGYWELHEQLVDVVRRALESP